MRTAREIKLEFWQDPQSDVILVYGERECSVYFRCWSNAGIPADYIAQLEFRGVSAVRSYPREFLPYEVTGHNEKSYILKVLDSDLASEYVDYRKVFYPKFPVAEQTHFVVVGHDIYHEILAASFDAVTIPKAEVTDAILLRLVANE